MSEMTSKMDVTGIGSSLSKHTEGVFTPSERKRGNERDKRIRAIDQRKNSNNQKKIFAFVFAFAGSEHSFRTRRLKEKVYSNFSNNFFLSIFFFTY